MDLLYKDSSFDSGITWYNNQQSNAVGTVEGVGKVEIGYAAGGGSPSSVTATGYYKVTYSGTA